MEKMTCVKLFAVIFGVCGSILCPVVGKGSSTALVPYRPSVGAAQYTKPPTPAMMYAQDDMYDAKGEYRSDEQLSTVDGVDESVRLQQTIRGIAEYAESINQGLAEMANTLGVAQDKSAEAISSMSTAVGDLDADVQRASTRLDVVAGTR